MDVLAHHQRSHHPLAQPLKIHRIPSQSDPIPPGVQAPYHEGHTTNALLVAIAGEIKRQIPCDPSNTERM